MSKGKHPPKLKPEIDAALDEITVRFLKGAGQLLNGKVSDETMELLVAGFEEILALAKVDIARRENALEFYHPAVVAGIRRIQAE